MSRTAQDVATRAVSELGAEYTQYNFTTDLLFQAYVLEIATSVTEEHATRVNPYSLDNVNLYAAGALETESRMVRRLLNMYYSNVLSAESITLGPISLRQANNATVSTYIRDYAESLHDQAESKLVAGGASGRKGAIRVWTPRNRITII